MYKTFIKTKNTLHAYNSLCPLRRFKRFCFSWKVKKFSHLINSEVSRNESTRYMQSSNSYITIYLTNKLCKISRTHCQNWWNICTAYHLNVRGMIMMQKNSILRFNGSLKFVSRWRCSSDILSSTRGTSQKDKKIIRT